MTGVASRRQLADTLRRNLVRQGGEVTYTTAGGSMLPTLGPALRVTVKGACLAELSLGDLVVVERSGGLLLHRYLGQVHGELGPLLLTKGDALPKLDSPSPAPQLVGKVTGVELWGHTFPIALLSRWLPVLLLRLLHLSRRIARHLYPE
jgi:hypothetical protein